MIWTAIISFRKCNTIWISPLFLHMPKKSSKSYLSDWSSQGDRSVKSFVRKFCEMQCRVQFCPRHVCDVRVHLNQIDRVSDVSPRTVALNPVWLPLMFRIISGFGASGSEAIRAVLLSFDFRRTRVYRRQLLPAQFAHHKQSPTTVRFISLLRSGYRAHALALDLEYSMGLH